MSLRQGQGPFCVVSGPAAEGRLGSTAAPWGLVGHVFARAIPTVAFAPPDRLLPDKRVACEVSPGPFDQVGDNVVLNLG